MDAIYLPVKDLRTETVFLLRFLVPQPGIGKISILLPLPRQLSSLRMILKFIFTITSTTVLDSILILLVGMIYGNNQ